MRPRPTRPQFLGKDSEPIRRAGKISCGFCELLGERRQNSPLRSIEHESNALEVFMTREVVVASASGLLAMQCRGSRHLRNTEGGEVSILPRHPTSSPFRATICPVFFASSVCPSFRNCACQRSISLSNRAGPVLLHNTFRAM